MEFVPRHAGIGHDVDGNRRVTMPRSLARPGVDTVAGPAPQTGGSDWWRYVGTVTAGAAQKDIAAATGIDQSSISRWQRGTNTPRAEAVVALARAYGRSPVEALVAAGYLSDGDLGVAPQTTIPRGAGATVTEIGASPQSEAARPSRRPK